MKEIEGWAEEKRSAYLYRAVAIAEAGTARQALFSELAQEAEQQVLPKMQVLEDHLAKHGCFAGRAWGMADFMVASVCYSMWFNKFPLLERFPKFKAWLDASVNRPMAKEARKLRE